MFPANCASTRPPVVPHRSGQVHLFLTDRVTAAQPDELRYADPSTAHPPTAQVIQTKVGITARSA